MLNELQIQSVLESVIGELKKHSAKVDLNKFLEDRGIRMGDDEKKKLKAEFYPEYYENIRAADRIRVHAEQGIFPSELFIKRAPNMTEAEYDYIEQNFTEISDTQPVWVDYNNTILRAFSDDNWSIKYQADDSKFKDETLQEYLEHGIKHLGSLENYVKNIVVPQKGIDAAGVIGIHIDLPIVQKVDADGNAEYDEQQNPVLIVDDSVLLEPQPVYHPCGNILAFEEDRWYFILSEEKTLVKEGDKAIRKGYKFILYDDTTIWHINQIGQYSDYKFEIIPYYVHNWDRVPVIRLKGLPKICKGRITWRSPFGYVTNTLNKVLLDEMYLFCIKAKCVFPYLVMVGHTCEFQDSQGNKCTEGLIWDPKQNGGLGGNIKCAACGGTGSQSRISPLGQLVTRPGNSLDNGDPIKPTEAMGFVSPPIEAPRFLREEIDAFEAKARGILHLYKSNTQIKGQENMTATGMGIDLKAMYAFIKPISDQVFTIYEFLIDAIGFFRYQEAYKKPELSYPATFDFNTEQDYLNGISEAKKAGLPPAVIQQAIEKYLSAIYGNNEVTNNIFRLVFDADRLAIMSDSEIQIRFAQGRVEKWESILHDSIFNFIKELYRDNPEFFNAEIEAQIKLLQDKAKSLAAIMVSPAEQSNASLVENIAAA